MPQNYITAIKEFLGGQICKRLLSSLICQTSQLLAMDQTSHPNGGAIRFVKYMPWLGRDILQQSEPSNYIVLRVVDFKFTCPCH
jgi:hypothetical protein